MEARRELQHGQDHVNLRRHIERLLQGRERHDLAVLEELAVPVEPLVPVHLPPPLLGSYHALRRKLALIQAVPLSQLSDYSGTCCRFDLKNARSIAGKSSGFGAEQCSDYPGFECPNCGHRRTTHAPSLHVQQEGVLRLFTGHQPRPRLRRKTCPKRSGQLRSETSTTRIALARSPTSCGGTQSITEQCPDGS